MSFASRAVRPFTRMSFSSEASSATAEPYFCFRLSTCFSGTLIVRMSRLMADAPIGIEAM